MSGVAEAFRWPSGPLWTEVSRTPPAWTFRSSRLADRAVTCTGGASEAVLAALETNCGCWSPRLSR